MAERQGKKKVVRAEDAPEGASRGEGASRSGQPTWRATPEAKATALRRWIVASVL